MLPYFLLIIIPLLFRFVVFRRSEEGARCVRVGCGYEIYSGNVMIPVFFLLLFLFLALRDETVGRDLMNYKSMFISYNRRSVEQLLGLDSEMLYALLNWCVGRFTDNYQWFLAVAAALTLFPIAKVYGEDRRNGYLKLVIFVNMSTFIMLFSGLRQALAMAVGMIAYRMVRKKKLIWFLILCLVAYYIHRSGFMILFMYPLYHLRLKMKHAWFIVPGMLFILVFNKTVFRALLPLLTTYTDRYGTEITQTGAYTMLILFVLFAVFAFVIADEKKMDQEMFGLRNFLLFAVALQCFAPLHNLAMRMNYYYILFIPILIPKVIATCKNRYREVAGLANIVLCVFFTAYFAITTYNSYVTGISTLDTIPYIPFWKG